MKKELERLCKSLHYQLKSVEYFSFGCYVMKVIDTFSGCRGYLFFDTESKEVSFEKAVI